MLDTVWKYQAHKRVEVATFRDSRCFAVVRTSRIVCLDIISGKIVWLARVENPWGWLAVTESHVFYLNQHEKLVALSIDTGTEIWSRHLGVKKGRGWDGLYGWLHAMDDSVIVGGWRGAEDVLCLNASDGTDRWSYPTKGKPLFGTYLYPEMGSVMIASRVNYTDWSPLPEGILRLDGGRYFDPNTWTVFSKLTPVLMAGTIKRFFKRVNTLLFIDIKSGDEVLHVKLPGSWTSWYSDRIAEPIDINAASAIILRDNNYSFFRVSGNPPKIERYTVDKRIWSINLIQVGKYVPFMSEDGSLIAYSVTSRESLELAKISHNFRYMLPFLALHDGSFVVGTSFGMVYLISNDTKLLAKRKIGKRVSTQFSLSDGILCCGTASGEIIGMRV